MTNVSTPNALTQNYLERFGGIARLYGEKALVALHKAHFVVVGLGGVGTWTAEALARTGIGTLTLIELDDVCVTNTNRQIHATASNIGRPKNHVIAERLKDINPEICIHQVDNFLHKNNIKDIIKPQHDIVIDATDAAHMKATLVAYCSAIKIRLILCGSSGGKLSPEAITVEDLGRTISDPMLSKVRRHLYRHHNFSRDKNRKFRVDAVYSTEQMIYPKPDGSVSMDKQTLQQGVKLDCAGGFGSAVMVTGTFGFLAASKGIERYLDKVLLSGRKS
ncbi:tRNA cyclic N6-threonylcarbamoyladenosine(37) synthase TcdA [Agarilytica rhodophyticola]|uniref:tRNA cyclic N6-threonylcarbamoyladenosine(37) synthase TcdA n=1 Tax=Agarilytica rhodophyticola TaxID=1737490 RepID=UPI000B3429C1|nr:tRNA cyclic N6-threonylcarbamoyladenosine(37) synthase TcdA [Agarilytica rhodophyticola]